MIAESRYEFNKGPVFGVCEQIGEAAVLADLEQTGIRFTSPEQKSQAWEWVYGQRIKRDEATGEAVRATAKQTMLVAVATFIVALFTGALVAVELWSRH